MSLSFDKATSRMKVHIVKARNLCCKAREGKKQDRCGISCSGDRQEKFENGVFHSENASSGSFFCPFVPYCFTSAVISVLSRSQIV